MINKFVFSILILLVSTSCSHFSRSTDNSNEKIYVVERERESLRVFSDDSVKQITDLGNLNHATMKFKWGKGYLLARNGYLSMIDIKNDQLLKKVMIGKSGIGLTFTDDYIAIVNYDPSSVVILSKDLEVVKTISTESRNVGVKVYKNYLIFSLMDKNEIWVLDINNNFNVVKRFENVGNLPFDALVNKSSYLVGFFNESSVGFLDLDRLVYSKISLNKETDNVVYKVPHFGYWGIVGNYAYVPIASHRIILVIDLANKAPVKEIEMPGDPVFASVSPDKTKIIVNYSGSEEDLLSVIDLEKNQVVKTFKAARRVMHLRYSANGKKLFVTSYFENKMHEFDTVNFIKINSLDVATPSGIFLNTIVE